MLFGLDVENVRLGEGRLKYKNVASKHSLGSPDTGGVVQTDHVSKPFRDRRGIVEHEHTRGREEGNTM